MSGALAERDFVEKLERAGFTNIAIPHRRAFSVDDATNYPLFTPDLIQLMRDLLSPEQQERVATSVVVKARLAR